MRLAAMRFHPKRNRLTRRNVGIGIAAIAVGALVFTAPALIAQADVARGAFGSILHASSTKTIPSVVGWTIPNAEKTLTSRGFGYTIVPPSGQNVITPKNWTVWKQAPSAKSTAKSGSKVQLSVEKTAVYVAAQIRKYYAQDYGTFTPVTSNTSGSGYLVLPTGIKAAIVTATYSGSGRFRIEELGAKGVDTKRTLVSRKKSYSGTTAIGLVHHKVTTTELKLTGKGTWTVTLAPIAKAPIVKLPAKGTGDKVYLYSGPSATCNVSSPGASSFELDQISSSSYPNLAVNEHGNWKGPVALQPGPSVVEIHSTGSWTIN